MIERDLAATLMTSADWYPVVTVTGARQSGKTTLVRAAFPQLPYVSLEPLDVRAGIRDDPRGFLADHPDGAVLDEVQHVPELLSYLQAEVDEPTRPVGPGLDRAGTIGFPASVPAASSRIPRRS